MSEALLWLSSITLLGALIFGAELFLLSDGAEEEADMAEARAWDEWDAARRADAVRRLKQLEDKLARMRMDA